MDGTPGPDPKTRLTTAIRGWIHMNNLVESFNHQAANARQLRSKHEVDAIQLLKDLRLDHSTIQVSGAAIQLARRRQSGALTWEFLDRELPRAGLPIDQSARILKWLREHRTERETEYLRLQKVTPELR